MNKEQLFDAIDKIDDKYVSETENYDPETMKIRAFPFIHIMPAVLVTASAASVFLAVYLGSQVKPPGDFEIDNSVTETTTSVSEQYTSEVSDSVKPVTEPENVTDTAVSGSDGSSPADTGSSVTEVSAGAPADPNVVIVSGNTAVSPKPTATHSGEVTGPSASPAVTQTVRPTSSPTNKPTATATVKPTVSVSASPLPTATVRPTVTPTRSPQPTRSPHPTSQPTESRTGAPDPTSQPTDSGTYGPKPTMTPTSAPTMSPTGTSAPTSMPTGSYPTSAPTMSPVEPSLSPTAMPMDEPWPDAVLPNYSRLKSLIDSGDYEQEKYSNKGREAFERIKSDGYFYVPDGFENSEVTVVSGSDSEDMCTAYYAYCNSRLCRIGIYTVDKDIAAESGSKRDYIRNRYGASDGNTYKLDSSDVWYNNDGAFFFIDDEHYCYITSSLEDTELKKIINDLSFTKINVN